jgi:hypothetical protein
MQNYRWNHLIFLISLYSHVQLCSELNRVYTKFNSPLLPTRHMKCLVFIIMMVWDDHQIKQYVRSTYYFFKAVLGKGVGIYGNLRLSIPSDRKSEWMSWVGAKVVGILIFRLSIKVGGGSHCTSYFIIVSLLSFLDFSQHKFNSIQIANTWTYTVCTIRRRWIQSNPTPIIYYGCMYK